MKVQAVEVGRISGIPRFPRGRGAPETPPRFHLWKWRSIERTTLEPRKMVNYARDRTRPEKLWWRSVAF
ncbi:hypothetical protein JTE90_001483 [Oedothorax gibbosus]|uniref:Uncharacterized protein n=1 Tax=Oedothorax gibbosus TaxID=931172 RepID=A0AAV6TH40_9ARAC|nr:hypothetical protein JTE90_001483 [Oedothorax gibbosus]